MKDHLKDFVVVLQENFQQTNPNCKPIRSTSSSSNVILNACCVSGGQYSMHSRAKHILNSNSPKWFLNVQWDLKVIDIHLDSIIGTITPTHLSDHHHQQIINEHYLMNLFHIQNECSISI